MDLDGVRTFVAVVDGGRFRDAAAVLGVTQQAVSKRIAALETRLGVRLFARGARGASLTPDGAAFLPYARELLRAETRALDAVRAGRRPLRVDVIGRRLAPAGLLHAFSLAHPEVVLDVVTLEDAVPALREGSVDASFRAVPAPLAGLAHVRVHYEPVELVTGPAHPLATAPEVSPAMLVGHRVWIPGLVPGTEWATYYADLAAAFGLTIVRSGPGAEPLLDTLAHEPALATLVGAGTRLHWPPGLGLRRVPLTAPTPVYPHALVWRRANPHPALATLREWLAASAAREERGGGAGAERSGGAGERWAPEWAR
ncbi:LysR family transcriptional regulator [Streptomyces sp. CLI2509]|uniref:LysR family transcriptional regulator n=2 Tax=unclassified Streptomyces TaxID=2593676 RepID=UPI000BACDBDD|nr:LysR family transcriptional regulator [Streptomyces sp. CLI2509]ASY35074.1 LysR family transcriptional regulator [Streptomyces sp. CLI2509]